MKHGTVVIISIITLCCLACAPASKITGSWKNGKQTGKKYTTVFIAVLTANTIAKSAIESNFESSFSARNIGSTKSIDEFPPKFSQDSIPKEEIMKKVKQKGSDAILTITIFKKATETRYTSGAYAPDIRFGYYTNFWGYYNHWSPFLYSPDYYVNEELYYLETNLYDIATETLIWSAQSDTYSPGNLNYFSKDFAREVVDKMRHDGIFKV